MNLGGAATVVAALLLSVAACASESVDEAASDSPSDQGTTAIQTAGQSCMRPTQLVIDGISRQSTAPEAEDVLAYDDASDTLAITTPEPRGDIMDGVAYSAMQCVTNELGAPKSLLIKLGGTTAMTGPQTSAWDRYVATWTYSSGTDVGDGLNATIEPTE